MLCLPPPENPVKEPRCEPAAPVGGGGDVGKATFPEAVQSTAIVATGTPGKTTISVTVMVALPATRAPDTAATWPTGKPRKKVLPIETVAAPLTGRVSVPEDSGSEEPRERLEKGASAAMDRV